MFLTGRYNHLNGVANNHTDFPPENTSATWSSQLEKAGYVTGYVGKFHHDKGGGQRPGFDYSASYIGQGHYWDCPFEIDGKKTPTVGWVDDVSTDLAIGFLRENRDKPFALVVGYKSPHGPSLPPPRVGDRYSASVARPVPNLNSPPIYGQPSGGVDPRAEAGEDGRRDIGGYFGTLAGVDDDVGKLLAALDDLKLTDNTVVIFTSDNGFYLGEHELSDKRSAYEESLRIPLIVRWPKLGDAARGKVVDQMALNLDLAPTLLDLAGVEIPRHMQGMSWRPLLEGDATASWRSSFFYEYFYEEGYSTPTTLAVRTDRAKLIKYPGHDDWTELFDLSTDPYETKNLAADLGSSELLASMQAEFERQAKAVHFRIPDYADPVAGQRPTSVTFFKSWKSFWRHLWPVGSAG